MYETASIGGQIRKADISLVRFCLLAALPRGCANHICCPTGIVLLISGPCAEAFAVGQDQQLRHVEVPYVQLSTTADGPKPCNLIQIDMVLIY
jgi:hypothetical protein